MSGSRGEIGAGPDPLPLENHKAISFVFKLAVLVQIPLPLEITKLLIQHLMLGHHRPASKALFKLGFAGGPMMACLSRCGV